MSDGDDGRWVFECTECGRTWANPEAPVIGHFCDQHPKDTKMPEGEPADVECIEHPDSEESEGDDES
jgi:hypothetical protein